MKYKTLTQVSVKFQFTWDLYQDRDISGRELLKMRPKLSKATIYRRAKKPVADKTIDKGKRNHVRTRKISPQEKCLILRQIPILWEKIRVLYYQTIKS